MKLLIDIGNTAIKFATLKEHEVNYIDRFYTCELSNFQLDKVLNNLSFKSVYISSVVPKVHAQIDEYFKAKFNLTPHYIKVGDYPLISIQIDNPKELGIDLYCDIIAGYKKAKEINQPVIVIDLGTASKLLLIGPEAVFSSCAILPGINMSKKMLSSSTALLPEVERQEIKKVTEARNTVEVINSSVYYGHIEMINGLLNRIEKEIDQDCYYIITGGDAGYVYKNIKTPNELNPILCFEGIAEIIR